MNCATDPTCCFCTQCFEACPCSSLGHRFLMTRVNGGGICDCGDSEAWKPEGFCRRHGGGRGDAGAGGGDGDLPEGLRKTAPAVLEAVVQYCCEVQCKDGPRFADVRDDDWVVILHNDDVHDFGTVMVCTKSLFPPPPPPPPPSIFLPPSLPPSLSLSLSLSLLPLPLPFCRMAPSYSVFLDPSSTFLPFPTHGSFTLTPSPLL